VKCTQVSFGILILVKLFLFHGVDICILKIDKIVIEKNHSVTNRLFQVFPSPVNDAVVYQDVDVTTDFHRIIGEPVTVT